MSQPILFLFPLCENSRKRITDLWGGRVEVVRKSSLLKKHKQSTEQTGAMKIFLCQKGLEKVRLYLHIPFCYWNR